METDWLLSAACRGEPTATFYPGSGDKVTMQRALAICAGCTVRGECLDDALCYSTHDDIGVRGGFSAKQRFLMRRTLRRAA